jgi:hypothetical protein
MDWHSLKAQWLRDLQWNGAASKKDGEGFPLFFVSIPIRTTCTFSPVAKEPIFVAILLNLLEKKKKKKSKWQVIAIAWQRWTKWWRGECYPAFVIEDRRIKCESFVLRCDCRWKKKKKKVMERQRRSKEIDLQTFASNKDICRSSSDGLWDALCCWQKRWQLDACVMKNPSACLCVISNTRLFISVKVWIRL